MINSKYVDGLELRIKELNKKLSDEADATLHLIAENSSLKAERDAMASTAEALKEALKPAVRLMRTTGQYSGWHEKADEAESLVNRELATQQHLAEIRARAGRDGFFKGVAWILDIDVKDISAMVAEEAANQYAENIRQEKK